MENQTRSDRTFRRAVAYYRFTRKGHADNERKVNDYFADFAAVSVVASFRETNPSTRPMLREAIDAARRESAAVLVAAKYRKGSTCEAICRTLCDAGVPFVWLAGRESPDFRWDGPPEGADTREAEEPVQFPPGDAALTRLVKRLAAEAGEPVHKDREWGKYGPVITGYRVARGILAAAEAEIERRKPAAEAARQRREGREVARFLACLEEQFPGCPGEEAGEIAEHACETDSGRVGRISTLDLWERVRRAVAAHVRHHHTEYEELLDGLHGEEGRRSAREAVADRVRAVLDAWEAGSEA